MNWVGGFTDPDSALTLIASGGIPVKGLTSGGKIVMVRMEHVWVEAYVDYIPSRGAVHKEGDTWIPMDASYKQYSYKKGLGFQQITGFDAQDFINQITSKSTTDSITGSVTNIPTADIQAQLNAAKTSLKNYIDTNLPDATIGDVIGSKDIIQQSFNILPVSLPNKVVVTGNKFSEIPDSLRHKITISIKDPYGFTQTLTYTASLPQIAGKRLTLAYMPATQADARILETYGYYKVKPYLVTLKPVLYIDGSPVTSGSSIGMGEIQDLTVTFARPNGPTDKVTHKILASTYASIGLDLQRIPKELLDKRKTRLEQAMNQLGLQDVNVDEIIGEILNLHSLGYFYQVEVTNRISANGRVVYTKQPAEMLSTLSPSVSYLYGVPYSITSLEMNVDVKRYILGPVSLSGDARQVKVFMLNSGTNSSGFEHAIFEELHQNTQGVSAVKILFVANQQGIPIYTIDSTNIATILPRLQISPHTMADIQNAIATGKRVTIHEQTIQYYDWKGEGYIVIDPITGAGAYMISGRLSGGGTANLTDEVIEALRELLGDAGFDIIEAIIKFQKITSPAIVLLNKVAGFIGVIISTLVTVYDMFYQTNSKLKAISAGILDLVLSLLTIIYMAAIIFAASELAAAIVGIILVALVFFLIKIILLELIRIASLQFKPARKYYAKKMISLRYIYGT